MKLFQVVVHSSPHWFYVTAENEHEALDMAANTISNWPTRENFLDKDDFEIECLCEDTSAFWVSDLQS